MTELTIPNWRSTIENMLYNFFGDQRRSMEGVAYYGNVGPDQLPPIALQALALMHEMYHDPNLTTDEAQYAERWDEDFGDTVTTDTLNAVRLYVKRDPLTGVGRRAQVVALSRTPFEDDEEESSYDWFYVGDWATQRAGMSEEEFAAELAKYPHYSFEKIDQGTGSSAGVRYGVRYSSRYAEAMRQRVAGTTSARSLVLGNYVNPTSAILNTETMTMTAVLDEPQRIRPDFISLYTHARYITWIRETRLDLAGLSNREPEPERRDTSASYDAFRRSLPKSSEIHILSLPIQEHGTKASRRWGIEIETGAGRDLSGVPEAWDGKGDASLQSAYSEVYIEPEDCEYAVDHEVMIVVTRQDTGEEIEIENPDYSDPDYCNYCGTVEPDYDSDDCIELVSPILTSFHSRGLAQITADLGDAPVTDTAGVHVHVEAKDLTPDQVANLILIYDRFEPFIEASYQRRERGYCKLRSTRELLEVVRRIRKEKPSRLTQIRTGDRYVTVNLQALSDHGTIEFRAMGPVYNYDLLVRWAQFCREMVNAVANGATPRDALKVKDWDGVMNFFRKFGTEVNRAEAHEVEVEEVATEAELLAV